MRAQSTAFFTAVAILGLAACGGGDAGTEDELAVDTPAAQPEPAATPGGDAQVPDSLPEGVTAEMIAQGGSIFRDNGLCYTCHGQDATGGPLAPNLTDDEWLNVAEGSYDEIVGVIQSGVAQPKEHAAAMPPMGGASLSEEQVRSVAAYVWALAHSDG